jgi:hypothetical protein
VTLAVAAAAGLGYYPTLRLAGVQARSPMLAGCLVGLIANWLGLASLHLASFNDPARRPTAVLTAMAVRFAAVLLLALAAALSGWFERGPLLIWVAISYLVALFVETLWLVHARRNGIETDR